MRPAIAAAVRCGRVQELSQFRGIIRVSLCIICITTLCPRTYSFPSSRHHCFIPKPSLRYISTLLVLSPWLYFSRSASTDRGNSKRGKSIKCKIALNLDILQNKIKKSLLLKITLTKENLKSILPSIVVD